MTSETVKAVLNTPHNDSKFKLIDTVQLANTCEGWRLKGIGPRYIKVGRLVRYRIENVDLWLESQTRNSTCDA